MRHPWKQFRWGFLSLQRLGFHWLFMSPQGLFALSNPCVTLGSSFRWWFLSPQGLFLLLNPCVPRGSSFVDNFWVGSDLVFIVVFWVHRGCWRCRIHASPMEAVSLRISKSTTTQFSLIISESIGAVGAVKSMRHHWKQFRWWFLRPQGLFALSNLCVTHGSSFIEDF
jgi:hypothetical protein